VDWYERPFRELSTGELYAILEARSQVFVVEQRCMYQDVDGLDRVARHVWAVDGGELRAYLRILPAGVKYAEVAIGRVLVAQPMRGTGLGRELMRRGLASAGAPVRLSAQAYLERFYAELGFRRVSDIYDDAGIPHVEMLRDSW
jgi:ElaA protein